MTYIFLFILGLFFGSFFGVLVDRIPRRETILKGRSRCEFCKKELKWYDLVPLFSFLSLKGKCRYCGAKLSLFYPAIELTTGVMFALTFLMITDFNSSIINHQSLIMLAYYLFIVSSFIVIFFTDLKYGIIPDKILFPAIAVSFIYLLIINHQSLIINLLSAIGAFAFFVIVSYLFYFLTKKEGLGGGDIKLSFLLGLFLGFPNIVIALYIAFLTGAIIAIILILWRKKSFQKDSLPFGPFLVFGALASLFFGSLIYPQVLNLLGLQGLL